MCHGSFNGRPATYACNTCCHHGDEGGSCTFLADPDDVGEAPAGAETGAILGETPGMAVGEPCPGCKRTGYVDVAYREPSATSEEHDAVRLECRACGRFCWVEVSE